MLNFNKLGVYMATENWKYREMNENALNEKDYYWASIAWDGYSEETEGEQTIMRYRIEYLFEDVAYYLDKFKGRDAYLACASHELNGEEKDITSLVLNAISTKKEKDKHGK